MHLTLVHNHPILLFSFLYFFSSFLYFFSSLLYFASQSVSDKSTDDSLSEETSIDLSHEIERILVSNKDSFDPKDRDIFILYVSGYSITDIANETGLKYHYVRSRINSIKEKIQKYFVHS